MPFIILFLGLVCFFAFYNLYGETVSPFDCLFNSPQNLKKFFGNPFAVLSNGYSILIIRIFWYIWWSIFIISLFFVGRQFQKKTNINSANAILTMKEPYLLLKDICYALKQIKDKHNIEEFNILFISLKRLEERVSVESDFGYGNNRVISCENDIAIQLQLLRDLIFNIERGDIMENIHAMSTIISNVNYLLCRRIELKKRKV